MHRELDSWAWVSSFAQPTRSRGIGGKGTGADAWEDASVPGGLMTPLEREPHGQLDTARLARRRHLPESRVGLVAGRVEGRGRVHAGDLHRVERVVELGAELQGAAAFQCHVLEDRDVVVDVAGRDVLVADGVAEAVGIGRPRDALGFELPQQRALAARQVRIADYVDTAAGRADAAGDVADAGQGYAEALMGAA